MAQQELDPPEIDAGFEEMRRKGVTKHMRMDPFERSAASPACRQTRYTAFVVIGRVRGWPGKSHGCGLSCRQYCRNKGSNVRREHDRPILLAFALPHPEDHARAVDIGDLQLAQFGHPQARGIEGGAGWRGV